MVSIARQRLNRRRLRALVLSAGTAIAFHSAGASSLPQNPTAVEGSIATSLTPGLGGSPGQTLTIDTFKNNTIINWQSFNIASGNTVIFNQPGANSRVLNRINGTTPSQIHGQLMSNGQVFLVNPAGVIFGPTAVVNTGGLLAAAGNITNQNFLDGHYHFTNLVGGVENYGSIHAPTVALVGRYVTQAGTITGPAAGPGSAGSHYVPASVVILAAGENVLIGEAFGSVFVSAPMDLADSATADPAPMSAGDVFSIAAWHAAGASTTAQNVHIASRGTATLDGTINVTQQLHVNANQGIALHGAVLAGSVMLRSDLGGIAGNGVIAASSLTLDAQGDIDLPGSTTSQHKVAAVTARSQQGGVVFANQNDLAVNELRTGENKTARITSPDGSITIAGAVQAGRLELIAQDGALIGQGLITASQLDVLAGLGVDLRGVVDTLSGAAGQTADSSFSFDNHSGVLKVGGVSATLDVLITSDGGISIVGGHLTAGGDIALRSASGTVIAHIGDVIAGGQLDIEAGGVIDATRLLKAEHARLHGQQGVLVTGLSVASVEAVSAAGDVQLFNNGALLVRSIIAAGDIAITSTGDMTISLDLQGQNIQLATIDTAAGMDGPSILIEARLEASEHLALDAAGDLRTIGNGFVQAPAMTVDAGGNASLLIEVPASGTAMDATTGGDLLLTLDGGNDFQLTSASVGGNLVISQSSMGDAGGVNLTLFNISTGGSISHFSTGTITVSGTLQAGVNELISLTGTKGILLSAGSQLTFAGGGTGRRVLLHSATGSITQDAGSTINAGQLQAIANTITLPGISNSIQRFAALADNAILLNTTTDLTIGATNFGGHSTAGVNTTDGDITITNAGHLTIADPVLTVMGDIALAANGGGIDVQSDVVGNVVSLNATNDINAQPGSSVVGVVTGLTSLTGNIAIDSFVQGYNTAAFAAQNDLTIGAAGLVRGDQLSFISASGSILNNGVIDSVTQTNLHAANGSITSTNVASIFAELLQAYAGLGIDLRVISNPTGSIVVAATSEASDVSIAAASPMIVGAVDSSLENLAGVHAPQGNVNLRSLMPGNAGISIQRPVSALDTVWLDTRGTLAASGLGRITAANLVIGGTVVSDDDRPLLVDLMNVDPDGLTNEVATVDVRARGQVLFRNDGALLVKRISTSDFVRVNSDGSIQVMRINTNGAGDVALIAESGDIELLGGAGTTGIIADGQTVLLDARGSGARVLDAGNGEAIGTITAAQLKVLADAGIFLEADHNVSTLAAITRTGDLRFFNTGDLTIGEVGPIANLPGDTKLAGLTTLQGASGDTISIESGAGSLVIQNNIATFPDVLAPPSDVRTIVLRADNGMIVGNGRSIAPRLEAFARNGIELRGENLVGTLVAHVAGGVGPYPPMTPNGIDFHNAADLIVESAIAPAMVRIAASGHLRFQHASAGTTLAGHAAGDLTVEDRGVNAFTLTSGDAMSLFALNDVIFADGSRTNAGGNLHANARRDIRQGLGGSGSLVEVGGNLLYDAGRSIQFGPNSTALVNGSLAHIRADGSDAGFGIRFTSNALVQLASPGGVLLDATDGSIGQAGNAAIIADRLEAIAAGSVQLLGLNQVSEIAGLASAGGFAFKNVASSLLTISALNLDGIGASSIGVRAINDDVVINNHGGSLLVAQPVQSQGGDASLTALANIIVPSSVTATQTTSLNAQTGAINVAGTINAGAGSVMQAMTGIDISGSVLGGGTQGHAQAGAITVSGLIDVNGNAIMTAATGPVVIAGPGVVRASKDVALIAGTDVLMSGAINAALAELNVGGSVESAGTITADQLLALAGQDINIVGNNMVARFAGRAEAGSIHFSNTGDLVIASVSRAAGGSADGVRAVNGTVTIVNADGDVTVAPVAGASIQAILADLRVTGGQLRGDGIISTPQLRALASHGIELTGANMVGTLAAASAGPILFNNQGTLVIGQVTGTDLLTTIGVQSPGSVSLFSQAGDLDIQSVLASGSRANLVARQGGIVGTGDLDAPEVFLLAQDDIDLRNLNVGYDSIAAASLGGSVRIVSNSSISVDRLVLSEPLRQIAGITAEQATIDGFFANQQLEVRADGNININVDRLVALNNNDPTGLGDAMILDTGFSASNPSRAIVLNGLPGSGASVDLDTQGVDGSGRGGSVRLIGVVAGPGKGLNVWAGPSGIVEFAGNLGAADARLGSVVVGDRLNDLQSFRDNGQTVLHGDVFVSDRLLIQGNTLIADRIDGSQDALIDVAGGVMELFGDVHAGSAGQAIRFAFDLDEQYEVINASTDEFAVRVPLRFYGSLGTEANPFRTIQFGDDLNATLASTVAFIDRDLRLNDFGQFNTNALANLHTDQAFDLWTTDGVIMGSGQRMLVLGDLNLRSNTPGVQHLLSDITVIGTQALAGFVGGNLRIDGDVGLLTRPLPLEILDRFTVLPSNALDTRISTAFDKGVDLIATSSIAVSGSVRRVPGRAGNGYLSTQTGGKITVGSSDFNFRSFGGSLGMAEALIAARYPGDIAQRIGPVIAFDLVATGPTNDNLGEALANALPELEASEVTVAVGLDARDIDVLQRELGLAVDTTPTPSDLPITTGRPRANAPTQAVTTPAGTVTASAPPVLRERISPEGVRQVVLSIFDVLGTADTVDTVRFPEFGSRRDRFEAFGRAFQLVYDEHPDLAAFRGRVLAEAATDPNAAIVASMLAGVDALINDVRDLGLTQTELETVYSVLADRFLNQAALTEQFVGDTPFNAALVHELLGFPPAGQGAQAGTETVRNTGDARPASRTISLRRSAPIGPNDR